MLLLLLGLGFGILAVAVAAVYRVYYQFPVTQLKRRSRGGDQIASVLYRAAGYGMSSKVLLGLVGLASLYVSVVFLEKSLDDWLTGLLVVCFIGLCLFMLLPRASTATFTLRIATAVAPAVAWLTERLDPLLSQIGREVRRVRPIHFHTGFYTKADLTELLHSLKKQPNSDLVPGELDVVLHALSFGDKLVRQITIPKRVVSEVLSTDVIGPVLMGELHATGHSRFPVRDAGEKEVIVGVLHARDMVHQMESKPVREVMRSQVQFVHEDYTLYQTLQAFLKTKQHLFVVVNEFEEYVGIVTIEDVLEQVIGRPILDEFDQYDDLRAVAASAAQKDHARHKNPQRTASSPVPDRTNKTGKS